MADEIKRAVCTAMVNEFEGAGYSEANLGCVADWLVTKMRETGMSDDVILETFDAETIAVMPSSGNVYADLGIAFPAHGAVRRNGDNTYVWDSRLEIWVQTKYADD
jgi:hypothetical protein